MKYFCKQENSNLVFGQVHRIISLECVILFSHIVMNIMYFEHHEPQTKDFNLYLIIYRHIAICATHPFISQLICISYIPHCIEKHLISSNFIVNFKGETYKTIHSFHNFPTRNQLCKAIVKDENFGGILQSFHRLGLASHQGKDDTFHLDLQDLHRFVLYKIHIGKFICFV